MNTHRYIARIVLEAETPLFVGSGEGSMLKDALVQKDFNGLPMIPGTALTGVLRHSIEDVFEMASNEKSIWNSIFGFQEGDKGLGSRLRLSSAYIMINENDVAEGFNTTIDDIIKVKFDNLPTRQHVNIDHKGVAADKGLFDNEVVYKGTRFKFEIELIGNETDRDIWGNILNKIVSPLFRIGQGTRNGYGNLQVHQIKSRIFDLTKDTDFDDYSDFDMSLNKDRTLIPKALPESTSNHGMIKYTLELKPDSDFFIFSEGFGDEDVDNKPLEEEIVVYRDGKIDFEKQTVIPASSIKGALSHRTAFHYNKLKGNWAETLNTKDPKARETQIKLWTGIFNEAVFELFGAEAGAEGREISHRGHVIIDDLYFNDNQIINDKIFNHVAIDRFTGGAMDGALFSEKVSRLRTDEDIKLEVYIDTKDRTLELAAFENALLDIAKGLLPLGGMTTKGMGIFTGTLTKNDSEEIISYHKREHEND